MSDGGSVQQVCVTASLCDSAIIVDTSLVSHCDFDVSCDTIFAGHQLIMTFQYLYLGGEATAETHRYTEGD